MGAFRKPRMTAQRCSLPCSSPSCSRASAACPAACPKSNEVRTPLKIRRRKPAARPQKRFPGEASWHWHVQLAIERIIAPLRIGVLAITYVAWLLSSHPAVAVPALARVLIIVAILYALADMLLL